LETIRDKFINLAGEIVTKTVSIQIGLSDKNRYQREIKTLLRKKQKLLTNILG